VPHKGFFSIYASFLVLLTSFLLYSQEFCFAWAELGQFDKRVHEEETGRDIWWGKNGRIEKEKGGCLTMGKPIQRVGVSNQTHKEGE